MENIKFKKATIKDLNKIMITCKEIVTFMETIVKIDQWDNSYPNYEVFENDIKNEQLYVLKTANEIIGFICINDQIYDAYSQVTWEEQKNFKVLHRVAINPKFHGKGYGKRLYNEAEKVIKNMGINHIRVDTYSLNIPMNKTIKSLHYNFKGQMNLKPDKAVWNCYEKRI